jgi:hypothetical protein
MVMTELETLKWIKEHVSPFINQAIAEHKKSNPDLIYTEDWLGAINMRETGQKIVKLLGQGFVVPGIWEVMKGDYSARPGEKEPRYHGYRTSAN